MTKAYSLEFKHAAVKRLGTERRSDIAKDLKLDPTLIGKWYNRYHKELGVTKLVSRATKSSPPNRRPFTDDQKREIVAQVASRVAAGEMRKAVAEDLGIHVSVLANWTKEFGPAKRAYTRKTKPDERSTDQKVKSSIALLKSVRWQLDITDPVHTIVMLVLHTLEGHL